MSVPGTARPEPRDEQPIRCPVCRAGQPPQPVCRRCRADLQLYCRAVRSQRRAEAVLGQESPELDALAAAGAYLEWLSPEALARRRPCQQLMGCDNRGSNATNT